MSQVLNITLKQIKEEFEKYQPVVTEEDLFWELILGNLNESTVSINSNTSKEMHKQLPVYVSEDCKLYSKWDSKASLIF